MAAEKARAVVAEKAKAAVAKARLERAAPASMTADHILERSGRDDATPAPLEDLQYTIRHSD